MWLSGRLMPDFKTIANFRKDDNGKTIRNVCRQFVILCRQLNLFAEAMVAIAAPALLTFLHNLGQFMSKSAPMPPTR